MSPIQSSWIQKCLQVLPHPHSTPGFWYPTYKWQDRHSGSEYHQCLHIAVNPSSGPVDVVSYSRIFCRLSHQQVHEDSCKKHTTTWRILRKLYQHQRLFRRGLRVKAWIYQIHQGISQCKSLFYTGNRGFPEEPFKYSLEYLNTSLALLVRLSLAPLYTVELSGSFVRAHSKVLGTEEPTDKDQKGKEQKFGIWTQSTKRDTNGPYYRCGFFLLSLTRLVSVLTIRGLSAELHSAWENWKEILPGRRIRLGPVPVKPDSWKPVLFTIDFWKYAF